MQWFQLDITATNVVCLMSYIFVSKFIYFNTIHKKNLYSYSLIKQRVRRTRARACPKSLSGALFRIHYKGLAYLTLTVKYSDYLDLPLETSL